MNRISFFPALAGVVTAGATLLVIGLLIGSWWGRHQQAPAATPVAVTATATTTERKVLYWYDPMSPTQKFDKPGKSPFMDMQLVPKYADEDMPADAMPVSTAPSLNVSTQAMQTLGVRLATVSKRTIAAQVDAVATVQWNDRDVSIVQARTSGFVQKVYGRAVGDVVAAGAPIADVLNPDWSGAQGEYLAVRATKDEALIAAARKRLLLLGMSEALIATVERTNTVMGVQTLLAPRAGMIAELGVRDGMTLSAGAMVARINGLATVWLEAAVPEAQLAAIKIGQMADARFAALPGEVLHGKVNAVLPEQDREARTTRVRIELPNPGLRLKPGLVAQVRLQGPSSEALVLPSEAVIRTGRRALVMLQDAPGKFRPVEVQLGTEQGDELVISGGLNEGQQVAASGQFLLDSEASLRGIESGTTAGSKP